MATTAVSLANSGLLTVEAASKYLGIRPVTMYEWIRMRKIEHIKMGRLVKFRQSVLDSYLIEKEADEKQAEKKRKRTSGEDWINQLAKHRASSLKGCKKWQNNNPDKMREYRILKVSKDEARGLAWFNGLCDRQEFACAICKEVEVDKKDKNGKGKTLCIDHNHVTGQIRELLCRRCNRAIGLLRERTDLCDAVKAYLVKHKRRAQRVWRRQNNKCS